MNDSLRDRVLALANDWDRDKFTCTPQHFAQIVMALVVEECAKEALIQRCERDTPWDLACTTIAAAIRKLTQGEG